MNAQARTENEQGKGARLKKNKKWETPWIGYAFISPWLAGILLFILWPMGQSLYFSFTDYPLLDAPKWIGIGNYTKMFTEDDLFWKSIKITIVFVVISVPLKLMFALFMAMLLKQSVKGMSLFRTAVYFPSLVGASIAIAMLWQNILGRDGFVVAILSWFGREPVSIINSPDTSLLSLIVLAVWQFGSSMVIFLAGLKQIPGSLYEASAIDGASKLRQFFKITLPMLSPVILFNLIMQVISAFQMFTQAFVITGGGPMNSTNVFALYLYERAFTRFEMGYASALAWILLVIIALVTVLIFATSRKWVFYETEGGK